MSEQDSSTNEKTPNIYPRIYTSVYSELNLTSGRGQFGARTQDGSAEFFPAHIPPWALGPTVSSVLFTSHGRLARRAILPMANNSRELGAGFSGPPRPRAAGIESRLRPEGPIAGPSCTSDPPEGSSRSWDAPLGETSGGRTTSEATSGSTVELEPVQDSPANSQSYG